MEIFNIGPFELLIVLLIALIVLGPGDMVKAGRTLGRFLRKIVTSPEWRTVQRASRELRYLPNRLMREANLEDLSKDLSDINKIGGEIHTEVKQLQVDISSWTTPPGLADEKLSQPQLDESSSSIQDPTADPEKPSDNT